MENDHRQSVFEALEFSMMATHETPMDSGECPSPLSILKK
jgi:hypothetical protein